MDARLRNQLTGAAIWFLALILTVGHWYARPVDFDPARAHAQSGEAESEARQAVIITQPLVVPRPLSTRMAQAAKSDSKPIERGVPEALAMQAKGVAHPPPGKPVRQEKAGSKKVGNPPSAKRRRVERERSVRGSVKWVVWVAAYRSPASAKRLVARLKRRGYDALWRKSRRRKDGRTVYAVRLRPVASRKEALRLKRALDAMLKIRALIKRQVSP